MLPSPDVAAIRDYCEQRVAPEISDQLRVEAVVAGAWTLYSADSSARWHRYEFLGSASDVQAVLREIDRDPTGISWG